jgi:hypothetical protein
MKLIFVRQYGLSEVPVLKENLRSLSGICHVKGAADLRMADRPYEYKPRARGEKPFHPVYTRQGLMSEENRIINILPVDPKQKTGDSCLFMLEF